MLFFRNNDDEELTEEFSEQEGISSTEDVKVKLLNTTPRDTEEDQLFQQVTFGHQNSNNNNKFNC